MIDLDALAAELESLGMSPIVDDTMLFNGSPLINVWRDGTYRNWSLDSPFQTIRHREKAEKADAIIRRHLTEGATR